MRGLTEEERRVLSMGAEEICPQSIWETTVQALRAAGRIEMRTVIEINADQALNTELGNLALRVCPVGELV